MNGNATTVEENMESDPVKEFDEWASQTLKGIDAAQVGLRALRDQVDTPDNKKELIQNEIRALDAQWRKVMARIIAATPDLIRINPPDMDDVKKAVELTKKLNEMAKKRAAATAILTTVTELINLWNKEED